MMNFLVFLVGFVHAMYEIESCSKPNDSVRFQLQLCTLTPRQCIPLPTETQPVLSYTENQQFTANISVSAVDALREFCRLRCQSVQNQLSGLDEPVNADHLNLSDMGSMNMGGAQPEKPGENAFPDRENSRPGNEGSPQSSFSNLLLVPICVIMLLAAILIAWKYKRKKHG